MKTAIMTDSNSGISRARAREMGIYLLPMPVIIGERTYLEEVDIGVDEYYELLAKGIDSTTSQPSPESLTSMWDQILSEGYDEVVYIPMTSGLSGSTAAAILFAGDYSGRVVVVDNHSISVTQMVAAEDALKMSRAGMTGREIKERLESYAFRSYIYVMADDMKRLAKGGRVTPAAAGIATALNIKPVLLIQGQKLDAFAKAHGARKAEKVIIEAIAKNIEIDLHDVPQERIRVFAGGTLIGDKERESWRKKIEKAFAESRPGFWAMPCSIATHLGTGAIAAAVTVSVAE